MEIDPIISRPSAFTSLSERRDGSKIGIRNGGGKATEKAAAKARMVRGDRNGLGGGGGSSCPTRGTPTPYQRELIARDGAGRKVMSN